MHAHAPYLESSFISSHLKQHVLCHPYWFASSEIGFLSRPVRLAGPLGTHVWAAKENGGSLNMQWQGVPSPSGREKLEKDPVKQLFGCAFTLHGNLCQTWKKPPHDLIVFSDCCWHSMQGKVHVNVLGSQHTQQCFSKVVAVIMSTSRDACV